jgi:hypothetical protein
MIQGRFQQEAIEIGEVAIILWSQSLMIQGRFQLEKYDEAKFHSALSRNPL